jgi:uncharacterized protein (DUF433 family)
MMVKMGQFFREARRMTVEALVDLDTKLAPPTEGARLAALEAWKRSLHQAGKEYAREVQMGVRGLLGAARQFMEIWELFRREVLAGRADEIQQQRDRFLRAFQARLAHLQEADQLARFASRVAASELPEASEVKEEIAALTPMLQRLSERWRTREDLERLVAEEQESARIVKTHGVCGGDARVKGTRLTVWGLEEWRRLGWSDARIIDSYPQLKPEDLTAVWAYVEQHRDEIEEAIRENQEA